MIKISESEGEKDALTINNCHLVITRSMKKSKFFILTLITLFCTSNLSARPVLASVNWCCSLRCSRPISRLCSKSHINSCLRLIFDMPLECKHTHKDTQNNSYARKQTNAHTLLYTTKSEKRFTKGKKCQLRKSTTLEINWFVSLDFNRISLKSMSSINFYSKCYCVRMTNRKCNSHPVQCVSIRFNWMEKFDNDTNTDIIVQMSRN